MTTPACWSRDCACLAVTASPNPLLRRIVAPSEKRIRTLIQELDAENLDQLIGGWLRDLAEAGRLEPMLTAIAVALSGFLRRLTGRPRHRRRSR